MLGGTWPEGSDDQRHERFLMSDTSAVSVGRFATIGTANVVNLPVPAA
jgi:hypothetical protein